MTLYTTGYEYLVSAAKESGDNGVLWFRYLGKVIQDNVTKITEDDIERLLKSSELSPFQKATLQDALMEKTHTREYVLRLNRKFKPRSLISMKEGIYGEKDIIWGS